MINVLCRPSVAAVVCLVTLLAGGQAHGQFLAQEIFEAKTVTAPMLQKMADVVDPEMDRLIEGDPEGLSEARKKLLQPLNYQTASPAFKTAFSSLITKRMDGVVNHEDDLVRMNAMIILTAMVDDDSKALIDTGLEDKSDAVKRWAIKAMGQRIVWWQLQAATAANPRPLQVKIDAAIKQIVTKLNQEPAPHPIVVEAALEALLLANTPASLNALIDQLNKRVELHAADASLSYTAERAAVESFASMLSTASQRDFQSVKGLSRAMYRYAALILTQAQTGEVSEDQRLNALTMLLECLQGLARTTAASGKFPPNDHAQAKTWIQNGGWVDLKGLIEKDWHAVLQADPFNLTKQELAVAAKAAPSAPEN